MRWRGEIATDFFAKRVGCFLPQGRRWNVGEMKLPLAIATSSVSASAHPFLDRTGIRSLFCVVVTGDEVQRGKRHPALTCELRGTSESLLRNALCIEDALTGVAAAKAANMRVRSYSRHALYGSAGGRKEADALGSLSRFRTHPADSGGR